MWRFTSQEQKGKYNYKVNMMPIGAKLKNMKRKGKWELLKWKNETKQEHNTGIKAEWKMEEEM